MFITSLCRNKASFYIKFCPNFENSNFLDFPILLGFLQESIKLYYYHNHYRIPRPTLSTDPELITISGKRWLRQFPFSLLPIPPSSSSPSQYMEREESTTPSLRQKYYFSSLDEACKERVRNADPNGGDRCLITNKIHNLNFCHCVPKQTMQKSDIVCFCNLWSPPIFIPELNPFYSSIALNGAGT